MTITAGGTQIPLAAVSGEQTEFAAYVRGYEDGLKLDGAMETDRAGVVVIPAGQTRITFVPRTGPESDSENPVQSDTLMLATVQGNVATSVLNVTLRPDVDTATIRLTRGSECGCARGMVHPQELSIALEGGLGAAWRADQVQEPEREKPPEPEGSGGLSGGADQPRGTS